MTWTATLVDVVQGERWSYRIVYTDGVQKVDRTYQSLALDDATIKATAISEVAGFGTVAASVGKVSMPLGQQIDLTPPATVQPAPADTARTQFLSDWNALQALNRAIAAGFVQANDPRIAPLQSNISKNWLDSYVGLV